MSSAPSRSVSREAVPLPIAINSTRCSWASREQQVAQVPGEHLHCGIFRSLPEPKAQVAFDVNQDPRAPSQAHCIDQPAVAGPATVGDLEPVRDPPLEGARFAAAGSGTSSRLSTSSFSPRKSARIRCDGNLARGSLNSK
jgi:hypothetical protein